MIRNPAREPVVGNAAAGLSGMLASLGIADVRTRTSVEDTIVGELEQRGFAATIRELRWGTLTLMAAPQTASLLRFDEDNLLAALSEQHPGAVSRVRVLVARP